MDVILSYLDNMFLAMPKTAEMLRAKEELATMMEDKYHELIAEGRKENEAVGIVISEFGDISELMEEFGMNAGDGSSVGNAGAAEGANAYGAACGAGAQTRKPVRVMGRAEAEEYMQAARKSGKWKAAGTVLCILCAVPLLICGGLETLANDLETSAGVFGAWSEVSTVLFGLVPLFILIGIGITCFIHSNAIMHSFGYMDDEQIRLDASYEKELCERAEEEGHKAEKMRIVSTFLFILCLLPLFIAGAISDYDDIVNVAGLCLMLMLVASGVALNIIRRSRRNCIADLLNEETGEDDEDEKKERGPVVKFLDMILGAYWYIITAVYLGWSLVTRDWGFTWIVWFVAWPLYAAIRAAANAVG